MCFPKSQEKATEKLRKGPVLLLCTRPPGLACPRPAAVGTPTAPAVGTPIPLQWAPPPPAVGAPGTPPSLVFPRLRQFLEFPGCTTGDQEASPHRATPVPFLFRDRSGVCAVLGGQEPGREGRRWPPGSGRMEQPARVGCGARGHGGSEGAHRLCPLSAGRGWPHWAERIPR